MKEKKKVHYVKGVFVCPQCRQSYVQEKWIEEWRVRCHKCDYRGSLTHVSVEEPPDEEIRRHRAANSHGLHFGFFPPSGVKPKLPYPRLGRRRAPPLRG